MLLQERQCGNGAALPCDGNRLARRQPVLGYDWRVVAAGRRLETIIEPLVHGAGSVLIKVDVDAAALSDEQRAEVVNAVGVVGMVVGVKHSIEPIDLGIQ